MQGDRKTEDNNVEAIRSGEQERPISAALERLIVPLRAETTSHGQRVERLGSRTPAPPQKTCRSAINAPAPRPAPTVVVRKRGPLAPLRKLIDLLLLGPLRRRLFGGGR